MAYFITPPITEMTDTFTTLVSNLKILVEDVLGFFPVGTIYESTRSTDPSTFRPGTWTALTGRFLVGAGTDYPAGTTGGEATHTLTVAEMPSHNHMDYVGYSGGGTNKVVTFVENSAVAYWDVGYSQSKGGDAPHNNMPPYKAVYMWERTA